MSPIDDVEYEDCSHCGGTGRDEAGDALGRCVFCENGVVPVYPPLDDEDDEYEDCSHL